MKTNKASVTEAPRRKGHWPKGKRRNPDAGWSKTLLALESLVENHWSHEINFDALALDLGVHEKNVWRWRTGMHRPAVATQEMIAEWVKQHRATLKKTRS